ncbi:hypothetical protein AXG93_2272s1000 [Marchantia polymorpha subsp. ruderalis]|uniref:Uncharacterized protein n=1 Tax=Marchantia polymorpha subsp. ruderalis TaxID=1480154 RepID=A0A176VNY3_MARPO|nr:hypothetical protein AXG93_2272s1000 [Marchantia polymorpha subsp. ruderalis]
MPYNPKANWLTEKSNGLLCKILLKEWDDDDTPKPKGYRGNPETWQIWDWAKVLGYRVGEDGDLTFDNESVKDGDKILSANEFDTNPEEEQFALPLGRTDGFKGRGKEWLQKRRKLQEVAVSKMQDCRSLPTKLRTPNARAKTKVKAQRLILEDDSSTESSVAVLQDRLTLAKWAQLEVYTAVKEKDGPSEKNL